MVLLGVHACAPFEEGSPRVDRWVGCLPSGLGVKREDLEKLREVGSQMGYLTTGENFFLLRESGTLVPLLTNAASAPCRPSHAGAGMLHTKSFPRPRGLEGAHHQ